MKVCEKCGSADVHSSLLPKGAGAMFACRACGHVKSVLSGPPAGSVRNDAGYKRWKKAVQERDGHRCQMPGCGKAERLETHHIRRWTDDPRLRYDPANGVVLCFECHHAIQDKEDEYIDLFTKIARENAAKNLNLLLMMRRRTFRRE